MIEAEENNNVELLAVSNSLKRANACIEEKNKHCVIIEADETELQYSEKLIILMYVYNYV